MNFNLFHQSYRTESWYWMAFRTWQTCKSMILSLKQAHATFLHLQIEASFLDLEYWVFNLHSVCNGRVFYFNVIFMFDNHLNLALNLQPHWLYIDEQLLSSYCSLHLFEMLMVRFLIFFKKFFEYSKKSFFKILEFFT